MSAGFGLKARYCGAVRWSRRGSCGNPGCTDAECRCALCGEPIGVSEDDPRWESHPEYCDDCDLCRDQVPVMLFRGEGKGMEQAQFHTACFATIVQFRQGCTKEQRENRMTTTEVKKFINETRQREDAALRDIYQTARMLIPLLKDRQMIEVAKDLETKFFILDAIKQEMNEFTLNNFNVFMQAILGDLK
jgi:hypothetical protein